MLDDVQRTAGFPLHAPTPGPVMEPPTARELDLRRGPVRGAGALLSGVRSREGHLSGVPAQADTGAPPTERLTADSTAS